MAKFKLNELMKEEIEAKLQTLLNPENSINVSLKSFEYETNND